ncbi:MAG: DUF3822 family protein [Ferruginibacter sp.]
MNPAFNLIPEAESSAPMHMLVETGWYGIVFAWYKSDPLSLEGVLSYNFNDKILPGELPELLTGIFKKNKIFETPFSTTSVFYNFKESVIVPGNYYKEVNREKVLDLFYGEPTDSLVMTDFINYDTGIADTEEISNIYRVPRAIHQVITENLPGALFRHSSSMQVQVDTNADLHCILYHNTIKVILIKDSRLQLIQQFDYITPEDVTYHLLNTCDKYNVDSKQVVLVLSGMIDEKSNLYSELYKYFLNINFESVSDEIFLSAAIRQYPSHFFSPLTALAKCVS